ncbi:MAG: biotin--[acetyl-CoA-carboxylase] ligase [Alphaproteobacteria bacterium]|jgi:BirA family biotin operon repressor/biotin-[acetyl-CoA-carboxylase] ligase|nr:biotin--[acetyl-CoA-carboxylase] ligase [Alphaproteobacteria bacterium]
MIRCFFDTIDSTNAQAKLLIENEANLPDIFSIITNNQTMGKGKLGSVWQSATGNLYLSIVLKIGKYFELRELGLLSILASVSLREVLSDLLLVNNISNWQILSKWPNDILVMGNKEDNQDFKAKISGILLEVAKNKKNEDYLIVGIGVNLLSAPKINKYNTISLFDITSNKLNNLLFANKLEDKFLEYLQNLQDNKINIIEKFKQKLYGYQQEITIKVGDILKTGVFTDITKEGYLVLDIKGNKEIITAGEVFGF